MTPANRPAAPSAAPELDEVPTEPPRRRLSLVAVLMFVGFAVTFGTAWFARPLAGISFLSWPLSYYIAAQGAIVVYVAILVTYATVEGRTERAQGKRERA